MNLMVTTAAMRLYYRYANANPSYNELLGSCEVHLFNP